MRNRKDFQRNPEDLERVTKEQDNDQTEQMINKSIEKSKEDVLPEGEQALCKVTDENIDKSDGRRWSTRN